MSSKQGETTKESCSEETFLDTDVDFWDDVANVSTTTISRSLE